MVGDIAAAFGLDDFDAVLAHQVLADAEVRRGVAAPEGENGAVFGEQEGVTAGTLAALRLEALLQPVHLAVAGCTEFVDRDTAPRLALHVSLPGGPHDDSNP